MDQFGSGQDPPAGICSGIWLSHVSWPDEAFPPQTALFRPPTPQDGPWLGRSYSSLLRSQHPHHRKGGSVTELENRRALVNNEDKVSCNGCGSRWWFLHMLTQLWPCPCATVQEACSAGCPPPPSFRRQMPPWTHSLFRRQSICPGTFPSCSFL